MICVDASLAAKWVLPEEHRAEALALLRATLERGEPIIAPPLLPIEVTNILRQRLRRADDALTLDEAVQALRAFLTLPLVLATPDDLHERSLRLAVYDAYYVALAQTAGCDLWTADRRLLRRLGERASFARFIGDYVKGEPPL
jgi:predicted nucleic acid-binding protein